jgi:hypothetical protein
MKFLAGIKFDYHDIWVGAYWKFQRRMIDTPEFSSTQLTIFICILPMLPIRFWLEWKPKNKSTRLTTDPTDPRLTHGIDVAPVPQADVYLVLSEEERRKGFVRPFRNKYIHKTCGAETTMGQALSETYARDPKFYGATYCVGCQMHRPVSEFTWSADGEVVGS